MADRMVRLRRQAALELTVLAVLTGLYLRLMPERPPGLDVAMALLGAGLVGALAWRSTREVWGAPPAAPGTRLRRSTITMLVVTAPVLALFALCGAWDAFSAGATGFDVVTRLVGPRFCLALIVWVPWALLQQTLFQVYLLGRWRALLPAAPPLALASLNGLVYGAVHLPDWEVTLVTMVGGVAWSLSFYRDRCLLPVALSHALLGASFFGWVRKSDVLTGLFG